MCGADPDGLAIEVLELDRTLFGAWFAVKWDLSGEGICVWIEALFGVVPGAGSAEVNRARRFWGGFGHLCLLGCSFGAVWAALFSPGLLRLEGLEEWG